MGGGKKEGHPLAKGSLDVLGIGKHYSAGVVDALDRSLPAAMAVTQQALGSVKHMTYHQPHTVGHQTYDGRRSAPLGHQAARLGACRKVER